MSLFSNHDGFPAHQISTLIKMPLNELLPLLNDFIKDGYLYIKRYGAHNYYCVKKRLDFDSASRVSLTPRVGQHIQIARTCYGHLAGKLGVMFMSHLLSELLIIKEGDQFDLTPKGYAIFCRFGMESVLLRRMHSIKPCLDWTERRYHLGSSLGKEMTRKFLQDNWVEYIQNTRAITITNKGQQEFRKYLGFTFSYID